MIVASWLKRMLSLLVPAVWSPQEDFVYPEVQPVDFSLLEKDPPSYRPFRWGPVYHVVRLFQ